MNRKTLILCLAPFAIIFGLSVGRRPAPAAPAAPPVAATADDVALAYAVNEVSAEARYADRCVLLSGVVDRVDAGLGSAATVVLREGFTPLGLVVGSVPRDVAAQLSRGASATLPVHGVSELLGNLAANYSKECDAPAQP